MADYVWAFYGGPSGGASHIIISGCVGVRHSVGNPSGGAHHASSQYQSSPQYRQCLWERGAHSKGDPRSKAWHNIDCVCGHSIGDPSCAARHNIDILSGCWNQEGDSCTGWPWSYRCRPPGSRNKTTQHPGLGEICGRPNQWAQIYQQVRIHTVFSLIEAPGAKAGVRGASIFPQMHWIPK